VLCCNWFREEDIPQSFATAKNRSSSPNLVRHIGWQLAEAREYLLTSLASTVSRRIYIYIRVLVRPPYHHQQQQTLTVHRIVILSRARAELWYHLRSGGTHFTPLLLFLSSSRQSLFFSSISPSSHSLLPLVPLYFPFPPLPYTPTINPPLGSAGEHCKPSRAKPSRQTYYLQCPPENPSFTNTRRKLLQFRRTDYRYYPSRIARVSRILSCTERQVCK